MHIYWQSNILIRIRIKRVRFPAESCTSSMLPSPAWETSDKGSGECNLQQSSCLWLALPWNTGEGVGKMCIINISYINNTIIDSLRCSNNSNWISI